MWSKLLGFHQFETVDGPREAEMTYVDEYHHQCHVALDPEGDAYEVFLLSDVNEEGTEIYDKVKYVPAEIFDSARDSREDY